jgi:hypothetical protein
LLAAVAAELVMAATVVVEQVEFVQALVKQVAAVPLDLH